MAMKTRHRFGRPFLILCAACASLVVVGASLPSMKSNVTAFSQTRENSRPPTAPTPLVITEPNQPVLVSFYFEGGDVPRNAALVLNTLVKERLVKADYAPPDQNGLCGVLTAKTQFPGGCDVELRNLGVAMNPTRTPRDRIAYPDAEFEPYPYIVEFDSRSQDDMKELHTIKDHWKSYIRHEERNKKTRQVTLTLTGYTLRVPIASDAKVNLDALLELQSKNVFVNVDVVSRNKELPRYSRQADDLETFRSFCTGSGSADACYCALIGAPEINAPKCAVTSRDCPDLVVVDSPVYLHPAIASSIIDGGLPQRAPPPPKLPRCLSAQEEAQRRKLYHGTELAGIVASQGQGMFAGVHPGARLFSRDADKLSGGNGSLMAQEMVTRRQERGPIPQIYMYASSWPYPGNADGMLLKNPEYRWTRNLIAARIKSIHSALWVVAAGQEDSTAAPPLGQYDIGKHLALGPMNLGDAENVVVVTACEDCRGMRNVGPKLMSKVNYSTTGFVHVAAPGESIPSTASWYQYGEASGTSPATAFVAGLASAMMTRWPSQYDAAAIKARLQYTARPWIPDEGDVVSSGVVDAGKAILDPSKDYLNGAEVDIEGWCSSADGQAGLTLVDDDNEAVVNGNVPTSLIHRIVKTQRTDNGRQQWFIYRILSRARFAVAAGEIVRSGPGIPVALTASGPIERRPVIKLRNPSRTIQLDNIDDLLVRRGRAGVVKCGS